jgi:hypothetical protein
MADTLDSIIKRYINEKGESSKHGYQRYLQMAIDGLDNLNFDVSGEPVFLSVTLGDQQVIPIPQDNVRIIGVHFATQDGQWISFARDNDMKIATDLQCGKPDYNENEIDIDDAVNLYGFSGWGYSAESYSNHFRNGEQTGAYYNLPGGNPYTFRENAAMQVVELSSNAPGKVILEYLPTSKQVNGQFVVHPFLREPLIAWLNYASVRSKSASSSSDVAAKKRVFINAKVWSGKQLRSFTKADFLDSFRKTYKQTPKF